MIDVESGGLVAADAAPEEAAFAPRPLAMRRQRAGQYLKETYGFCSGSHLAKLATVGGGPVFRKVNGECAVYLVDDLDRWAIAKLDAARAQICTVRDPPGKARRGRPPESRVEIAELRTIRLKPTPVREAVARHRAQGREA